MDWAVLFVAVSNLFIRLRVSYVMMRNDFSLTNKMVNDEHQLLSTSNN